MPRVTTPRAVRVKVPSVINKTEKKAYAVLLSRGLDGIKSGRIIGTEDRSKEGKVGEQKPAAGDRVKPGTKVHFRLFAYMVRVPDLKNMHWISARGILKDRGLKPSYFGRPPIGITSPSKNGRVASQNKTAGAFVWEGTTVRFRVYCGVKNSPGGRKVTVPNIIHQPIKSATKNLRAAHLCSYVSGSVPRGDSSPPSRYVARQTPTPGKQVRPATVIFLKFYK